MFQSVLISFREGLEAFLVIAIAAMYLRRTGRAQLVSALRAGTAVSVLLCIGLGVLLSRIGALSSAAEGTMALVAALAVITCTAHMLRVGKQMKGEIHGQLGDATLKPGRKAWWAVAAFAVFMVGREGVEAATVLASLAANADMRALAMGGLVGLLAAAAVSLAWTRQGHKVNLSRFFQVTAIFMVLFSVQLVIYAFHEFTEAGLVPGLDNSYWHLATEPIADGPIGQALSMGLVVLPVLWLIGAHFAERRASTRTLALGQRA